MIKQIKYILLSVSLVTSIAFLAITIINSEGNIIAINDIIASAILFVFAVFFIIAGIFISDKNGQIYLSIASFIFTIFIGFNTLVLTGTIPTPVEETLGSLVNMTLTEALEWGTSNEVTIEQVYDFSDTIPAYSIISQDISDASLKKNVNKIILLISSGPNPDKSVVVPNMMGWNIDDVKSYIDKNFLSNVSINFKYSEEEKNAVITQDNDGNLRRNDEINLTFSLGREGTLEAVNMEELKEKSLFDALFWLKQYGIKYKLTYEFSNTVAKDIVLGQDVAAETTVNPNNETITLIVSKGVKIVVPDILTMSVDEVTNWIIENKLKIEFNDRYDDEVTIGNLISSNVTKGDEIEEGYSVSILTSKGQLKMEKFETLLKFREWASKYGIGYEEKYEFSDTVASKSVISYSKNVGDIIGNGETIIIKVSQGKAIKVPSLVGLTKTAAQSKCSSLGLSCQFYTGSYSSRAAGTVTSNTKTGSTVVSGTSVVAYLSKGPASTYQLFIQPQWLLPGNSTASIDSLKTKFATTYPGVSFTFVSKTYNSLPSGTIGTDSPINNGSSLTQGKSYTIYVVK